MSLESPVINRYQIQKKIDTGGMASVFLACDITLNRDVALKLLHPHLLDHTQTLIRFTNEAKAVASLNHNNIIKIFDYGHTESTPFIVMEYIDGCNLQNLLDTHRCLPNLITLNIAYQIASGLSCAHKHGIIHRDIKPANILIDKKGTVYITDFGIAHLIDSKSLTLTGSFLGSPHYISPEQAQGKNVTFASDIFSLGIIVYRCLSGRLPFDGETPHTIINNIINKKQDHAHSLNKSALLWSSGLVERCLAKNPLERPDAETVAREIHKMIYSDFFRFGEYDFNRFLESPESYRKEEIVSIFDTYCKATDNAVKSKKISLSLRYSEQVKLLKKDNPFLDDLHPKYTIRKFLFHTSWLFLIIVVFIFFAIHLQSKHQLQQHPELNVSLVDTAFNFSDTVLQKDSSSIQPYSKPSPVSLQQSRGVKTKDSNSNGKNLKNWNTTITKQTESITSTKPEYFSKDSGLCTILTNPPWATMYIDEIERGVTPRVNPVKLSVGAHTIRILKTGYKEFIDTIDISASDTLTYRIKLNAPDSDDRP